MPNPNGSKRKSADTPGVQGREHMEEIERVKGQAELFRAHPMYVSNMDANALALNGLNSLQGLMVNKDSAMGEGDNAFVEEFLMLGKLGTDLKLAIGADESPNFGPDGKEIPPNFYLVLEAMGMFTEEHLGDMKHLSDTINKVQAKNKVYAKEAAPKMIFNHKIQDDELEARNEAKKKKQPFLFAEVYNAREGSPPYKTKLVGDDRNVLFSNPDVAIQFTVRVWRGTYTKKPHPYTKGVETVDRNIDGYSCSYEFNKIYILGNSSGGMVISKKVNELRTPTKGRDM